MAEKFKKYKCSKCKKFFLVIDKLFKSKKGESFICMDCSDEGEYV